MYTDLELFAGAGGLALGLSEAGFNNVGCVEMDKNACNTLRENRPNWKIIQKDIHNVQFNEYKGRVDLVSGGAPCQAFSYAGKKMGFGDIRGTLFEEYARCLDEVQPKMFIFENVNGLITHDEGRTFITITHTFEEKGYSILYKVLDACYYGVGQHRKRIFIIGIRNDLKDKIRFEYPEKSSMTVLRDVLKDCPKSEGSKYPEWKYNIMKQVPEGGNWHNLPPKVAKQYLGKLGRFGGNTGVAKRLAWDKPSPTLTASPAQKMTEKCHPEETRPLTIREYARIQSFPDDWVFTGSIANQYKQIGNAVPVELARRLGVQLIKSLDTQSK